MVELGDAAVADPAVLCAQRADDAARVAEPQDVAVTLALPLVVVGDLLDRSEGEEEEEGRG